MLVCVGSATAAPESTTFKLYRESVAPVLERVHVATFDAPHGRDYNFENCWTAAELFAGQPGVSVRYWCEASEAEE
jgi:hypothetical protein